MHNSNNTMDIGSSFTTFLPLLSTLLATLFCWGFCVSEIQQRLWKDTGLQKHLFAPRLPGGNLWKAKVSPSTVTPKWDLSPLRLNQSCLSCASHIPAAQHPEEQSSCPCLPKSLPGRNHLSYCWWSILCLHS